MSKRKRATPGRPFLGRTESIVVTMTPDEYREVMIEAAKAGHRLPIYVRVRLGLEG